jgi:putative endonuclease
VAVAEKPGGSGIELSAANCLRGQKVRKLLGALSGWFKTHFPRGAAGESPSTARGREGERHAARALQEKGFRIVASNWRHGRDEIDLVCADGEVLVFVEVKARSARALVPGRHAVDRRKQRALRRAIHAYLRRLSAPPRTFRFDVVEVVLACSTGGPGETGPGGAGETDQAPEVLHFENVPLFVKGYRWQD